MSLVLVGAVAAAFRVSVLLACRTIGFFERPLSDGAVYLDRARGIAAGDWLGPPDFVHAPLYAYVLGLLHNVAWDGPWSIRVIQIGFGAATCLFIMDMTRRLFGSAAAIVTGLIVALLPAAIFFDLIVQKTSLAMMLGAAGLWLIVLAGERPTIWRWLVLGAVLAMLILTRQNALILIPLALLWIGFGIAQATWLRRAIFGVAFLLGATLTLSPWVVRNQLVLGEAVLTTPNLGQNFAMGNHPDATGTYLPAARGWATGEREQLAWVRAAERDAGRPLTAGDVSDYYLRAAMRYITEYPAEWAQMTAKKLLLVWNAYELPDTEDFYLYRDHSIVLRMLDHGLHMGVLFPLAAVGLVMTWRHWRRLWPLYGWIVLMWLATAAFVVFARYRMPIVLAAAPFAGVGVTAMVAAARSRDGRRIASGMMTAFVVGIACNLPIHASRTPQPFSYVNHAVALADLGRYDEALSELDRAVTLDPGDIDAQWVRASVLVDLERYDEAKSMYAAIIDREPEFAGAWRGLGIVHMRQGRIGPAETNLQRARELDPDDPQTLDRLGQLELRRGETERARTYIERAVRLAPYDALLQLNHGNVLLALGRLDEAQSAYERAKRLRPWSPEAATNLAAVEATRGDWSQAAAYYREALDRRPGFQAARDGYVESLLRQGDIDAARVFLRAEVAAGRVDARVRDMLDSIESLSAGTPPGS